MKKNLKEVVDISLRYSILILLAFPSLWVFYFLFTPVTIYFTYLLFTLFFDTIFVNNIIIVNSIPIELIKACIAGSAYYLLLIFNLSVPNIKLKKRIKMILFSFAIFLTLNVLRIFLLTLIFMYSTSFFDITHEIFWYVVSIFFVVGIWFAEVNLFKIKDIPFYSDLKFLYKNSSIKK